MSSKSKAETRSRLYREINEYLQSWDPELGRPHHIMDKMWQMMQSNDTKTMNLDKVLEEMVSKAKHRGLNGSTKNNTVSGQKKRNKIRDQVCLRSNPQKERIMNFVAEWFSLQEVKVLQGVSVLTSVWAREWRYKDILQDIDGLVWEGSSEDL